MTRYFRDVTILQVTFSGGDFWIMSTPVVSSASSLAPAHMGAALYASFQLHICSCGCCCISHLRFIAATVVDAVSLHSSSITPPAGADYTRHSYFTHR